MKTKTKPKTKNAVKLGEWRKRLNANGGRIITTALSPGAANTLDHLKANGASTREVLEDALKLLWKERIRAASLAVPAEGGAP